MTFRVADKDIERGAPRPILLYLDGPFGPLFAGEMAAERLGHFNKKSSQISVRSDPYNANFIGNVARGRAVGVTTGQRFLLARWRGIQVIAFGSSLLDTTTAIFTLPQSGLRYPKDLVGKRLNFQPGSEDAVVFDVMMAQLGLPRSQVRSMVVQDKFGALRRGEVDAVVASIGDEPVPSDHQPKLNVIKPQDYGVHIPGLVYFASAELVRDNPSTIQELLRAVIAGWQDVYADIDKAVPWLVAYDPARLKPATVQFGLIQQRELVRPTGMRIADFDESRWNNLRDMLLFAKIGVQTESLSAGVNYQFLRDAYRRPLNSPGARDGAFGN